MTTDLTTEDRAAPDRVSLRVENIGGIDETEVTLHRGTTVLTGRNATNRTSLLQAVMAALGSDVASLKADAREGCATLRIGEETYRRTLRRDDGTVRTDGDPYLEDPELADLFAFLLEANEARRAVARGDDLRELIMRPVDTEAIRTEIDRHEQRKREIDERLSELDDLEQRLPELEAERTRLTDEIERLQDELADARAELEETNADVEERREGKAELEEKLEELRSTRSELEEVRSRIETERESIAALEDEREDVAAELESLTGNDEDLDSLEAEIERLRDERDALSNEINQLQSTIQFNERMLQNPGEVLDAADDEDGDGDEDVTDRLLDDGDSVACWTCGSSVPRAQIEATVDQLRAARKRRTEERNEIGAELDDRRERLANAEKSRERHARLRRRRDTIDDEIEERTDRLEAFRADREALTAAIGDLEEEIQALEDEAYEELLEPHREVNELEFELERTEEERADVEERIASIESQVAEREELTDRREEEAERLTDLRTRIERIEADAVEEFNEHMENVLELLGYDNLDRIWIRRSTREAREGRRTVSKSVFDLKVVRSTDDGSAYEDSIDHLSESEREVTGLVFALAGYLVHEVYRDVPFVLLDSLEAIDSERIADLVEYFQSYAPYLVVALLREDAQALETDHETVTEI